MQTAKELFDLITSLAAERPFRAERVQSLTGLELDADDESSNKFAEVSRSADAPKAAIRSAEVRTPRQATGKNGGMILLMIGAGLVVTKDQIVDFFGPKGRIMPSPPTMPDGAPIWIEYELAWGKLKFAMAPDGDRRLVSVVLDATNE